MAILNFHVETHINYGCTHMLWVLGAYASSPKKILTKRCSLVGLVYILIRLCLEKLPKN